MEQHLMMCHQLDGTRQRGQGVLYRELDVIGEDDPDTRDDRVARVRLHEGVGDCRRLRAPDGQIRPLRAEQSVQRSARPRLPAL
jgi:hypothetical protein